jgi:ABC-type transport system involved in Fe-S cluster assembly fused permease/ATPase subunit
MRPNKLPSGSNPDAKPDLKVIRMLVPYLREFPAHVMGAAACLVAAKVAGVVLPLVLKHIVDHLDTTKYQLLVVPLSLLLFYGALRFANTLFGELRDVVFSRVAERAMRRASIDVFEHLHALDIEFHLSRRTGGLSRDIERGVSGISFLLRFMLFNIVPTLLELVMVAAILFAGYGASFAVITAISVLGYVVFSIVTTEWRTKYVREANRLDSRANQRAIDSLLNFETVKLFGAEAREAREYDRFLEEWEGAQRLNRRSLALLNLGQSMIVAGGVTWMMVLAARGVSSHAMTLGDFVAINAYMIQLFVPLNFLGFVYREIRRALVDVQRMFDLIKEKPQVADPPSAPPIAVGNGHVRFENVSFAYRPDRPILRGVTFEIPPGRKVAVVGASGAGKSTLARLLFRFYDPTGGRITIDGTDIRSVAQSSLRNHIGVVPQDTVLFNDSLAYNIAYGVEDATPAQVERVVKLAHLDGFVSQLAEGLQTPVGERGLKLSGGEKQRVAIARALLKDPVIMVFDEATSSLDSHSERAILGALREVAEHRSTLVIAHRLSTITDADEIVVLDQGRVVERGSHAALIAEGGRYASLWETQQKQAAGKAVATEAK